uniref:DUF6163 family protein n=1 Tax=Pararhizobium sp. IMCC3301 TaxID=3067904 RepID=UPI0027427B4B|nr:DUF6163 family protein [Pararhizobium sp. IMCC3301]
MFEQILEGDLSARRYLVAALENFMRILGVLLLLAGLMRAMIIFGVVSDPQEAFLALSMQRRVLLIFFTIFNFTAAVGLWNKMPWGIVVWLITVGVDFFSQVFFSGTFGISPLTLIFHLIMIIIYVTLTMLIRRTRLR